MIRRIKQINTKVLLGVVLGICIIIAGVGVGVAVKSYNEYQAVLSLCKDDGYENIDEWKQALENAKEIERKAYMTLFETFGEDYITEGMALTLSVYQEQMEISTTFKEFNQYKDLRLEIERQLEEQKKQAEEEQARLAEEARIAEEEALLAEQVSYSNDSSDSNDYENYLYHGSSLYSDGVWYDDEYKYTWYSSNVLHHYKTSQWDIDDEGFYTENGYRIAASNDYPDGTIIEDTLLGDIIIRDSGCASGTLDMYVNW